MSKCKIIEFQSIKYNQTLVEWQRPVITEEKIYLLQKKNPVNYKCIYLAIPWASIIDIYLIEKKMKDDLTISSFCESLDINNYKINNPDNIPVFTVCQHYLYGILGNVFTKLGINLIFASHCRNSQNKKLNKIIVKPFTLYPINAIDDEVDPYTIKFKELKYNFIGATTYLTNLASTEIRRTIVSKNHPPNTIVEGHRFWHFNEEVYKKYIDMYIDKDMIIEYYNRQERYKDVLSRSFFTLCPTGAGPNSIRIWEAMSYRSVPVIIGSDLMLPDIGVDWKEYMVFLSYQDIQNDIEPQLEKYNEDIMSYKCVDMYKKLFRENFDYPIRYYFDNIKEKAIVNPNSINY